MGLIDSIKYNKEQGKLKSNCRKGKHSPDMSSWYDRANYLHSHCRICGKEIVYSNNEWREVLK